VTRILVTGALGQIGTELTAALRETHGAAAVLATDLRAPAPGEPPEPGTATSEGGPFLSVDCTDPGAVAQAFQSHRPRVVYHLAALLSAVGEERPLQAYQVNLGGLMNVLEACRETGAALFTPSSIAAFGPDAPREGTPQDTLQRPRTMYGVSKVAGELLCDYYHTRFGLDTRGVRSPGSSPTRRRPGEGPPTTRWRSSTRPWTGGSTLLPGPGHATGHDVHARRGPGRHGAHGGGPSRLRHRNAFNVTAMQLTPEAWPGPSAGTSRASG
jgi:nucleoside-diphosphate-sugar epimerase